jgi:hypothetical protein
MKTNPAPSPLPEFRHPIFGTNAEFQALLHKIEQDGIKFRKQPKAVQRAKLIREGILTPEGKLPVYPMNHVPLGPRE